MLSIALVPILIVAAVTAAPPSIQRPKFDAIDTEIFKHGKPIYTGKYDIVDLLAMQLPADRPEEIIFFVEAEIKGNDRLDRGLYVLKNRTAIKLLDNGRDITSDRFSFDTAVYFGAKDGLYVYDEKENVARKYGNFNDEVLSLVRPERSDFMYVVTADRKLYKVTEKGRTEVNNVKNVEDITMDEYGNVYYYDVNKDAFVIADSEVVKVTGLPARRAHVKLVKPPYNFVDGAPLIVDDEFYTIYPNGTALLTDVKLANKPTAYAFENIVNKYYALDKTIYHYSIKWGQTTAAP